MIFVREILLSKTVADRKIRKKERIHNPNEQTTAEATQRKYSQCLELFVSLVGIEYRLVLPTGSLRYNPRVTIASNVTSLPLKIIYLPIRKHKRTQTKVQHFK